MARFTCPRGDDVCTQDRRDLGFDDECVECWRAAGGRSRYDGVMVFGFTGPASTKDSVQQFWETGDPVVFDQQKVRAAGARAERRTRIG